MKLTIAKKPFKGHPVGTELELTERQAKLLVKMGRGQYLTRDMVAAPVDRVAPFMPPRHAPATAPVASAPADTIPGDRDSAGAIWNAALHVSTRLKNSDGTWRKRPGTRTAEE